MRVSLMIRFIICIFICFINGYLCAMPLVYETRISLIDMFAPNVDWSNGIKGQVSGSGYIEVKLYYKHTNTLIYHSKITSASSSFSGVGVNYDKSGLGAGAIYYPDIWNSLNLKDALFAIDRKRQKEIVEVTKFLSHLFAVRIEITEQNALLEAVKIPGIGILNREGGNTLFHPSHYCYDIQHNDDSVTQIWKKLKMPRMDKGSDLMVAAHRGFWGDNLGNGFPENSTGAFEASQKYTDILETDIMITKDKRMVISHDYSLSRLSNYSGPLSDYLFDLNSDVLAGLFLRKRNTNVSSYPYLFFEDIVDLLIRRKMVLTVDIKDVRARRKDGQCIANCEYDPTTHGNAAKRKIKESWMTCLQICIRIAESKNALQYLAFKTPFTFDELAEYVPKATLRKVLFMPVIQPNRIDYLDFTDNWILNGGKSVVAYETNFLNENDPYLKAFTKDGFSYTNLLHYVYKKTGLRSGCYPEEAIGQMGTVTRWVEWKMKYTVRDRRGDHYWLMTVPYGKIMVLTSDRPDIWNKINDIYNTTGL